MSAAPIKSIAITSPLDSQVISELEAGDIVSLSGTVYTARDQAHQRLTRALAAGETPPVDLDGQTIFYAGPAPAAPGAVIGAIGPTTAARMDPFTPTLLEHGVRAMIGKGNRTAPVKDAIFRAGAVYLTATGGAAAYLSQFVKDAQIVAYEDLGPEAIRRLELEDMPLVVAIDSQGRSALWPDFS
jgi:fumarate hydratase subunit beta